MNAELRIRSVDRPPSCIAFMSPFEQAAQDVRTLTRRPSNMALLRLYALYRQGTEGDATGERPSATAFVDRAKFDAWAALSGTSQEEAQAEYVSLVQELRDSDGED